MGRLIDVEDLVNQAEIGDLLGIHQSAISNWKNRYRDFPAPVTHKLYDLNEFIAWYEKQTWHRGRGRWVPFD